MRLRDELAALSEGREVPLPVREAIVEYLQVLARGVPSRSVKIPAELIQRLQVAHKADASDLWKWLKDEGLSCTGCSDGGLLVVW
jgi:hypothetical protein